MAGKIDKVIVTNLRALSEKYGTKGMRAIRAGIRRLIAADKKRGLQTILIGLDDKARMKSLASPAVVHSHNPKQNKAAIDGIYRALAPDYIMILGSRDVIPHQDLRNLTDLRRDDDPDRYAWSDLPYACEAPYSRTIGDFQGPTRVVGRLPDITGGRDAKYLVGLLKTAARYKQVDEAALTHYFAVSARAWQRQTARALKAAFRTDGDLQQVPPRTFRWNRNLIKNRVHFINCHGLSGSSRFYGQLVRKKKVALDASYMDGKVREGTLAAVECCYGGELYPLSGSQPRLGMCNVYLENGSYGFFASTTLAYGGGGKDPNSDADLICQFFTQRIRHGDSLGSAALHARHDFVKAAKSLDSVDLKTIAQFTLYGDPSLTPLRPLTGKIAAAEFAAERGARHQRRRALFLEGRFLTETAPRIRRSKRKIPAGVLRALRAETRRKIRARDVTTFSIQHAPGVEPVPRALSARQVSPSAFHVVTRTVTAKVKEGSRERHPQITMLIGKEVGGKLIAVKRI